MMPNRSSQPSEIKLLKQVTCPHCWVQFAPEDVLWVAAHRDLRPDPIVPDAQRRFLPDRFDVRGLAIDSRGGICDQLACPKCHLTIPRAMLEMSPLFVSIVGAPFSGKSYYLASMTSRLKSTLLKNFRLSFGDADTTANSVLNGYEETLFHNPQGDVPVTLPKTEKEGHLYESVKDGDHEVWYPRPFVFTVRPNEGHAAYAEGRLTLSRCLCLYDNAGEHFLPGGESLTHPCRHLALSGAVMFLFDPTQHRKFRQACATNSSDPQMGQRQWIHPQHTVLQEAVNRIHKHHAGKLSQAEKYDRPLIFVVTKFDAWSQLLLPTKLEGAELVRRTSSGTTLDMGRLGEISAAVRKILDRHAEEVVAAAEGFFKQVIYIPVSALGRAPEADARTGGLVIRPRDIKPFWVDVPMLYALHATSRHLIPVGRSAAVGAHAAFPPSRPHLSA